MIYLDKDSDQTICACDRCGVTEATDRADGVAVAGWMTGQLWLDISLSDQRQIPLCFCADCVPQITSASTIQVSAAPWGPVVEPPPPPDWRTTASLTRSQLLIGLVAEGWITEADGSAWLAGTLPGAVEALIAQLPPAEQFAARTKALTATTIPRLDPMVTALGMMEGKTEEDLDAFFLNWALEYPVWPEPEPAPV